MSMPKLRFPEFRDKGEWEEKLLSSVSEINPCRHSIADSMTISFVPMSAVSEDGSLIAPELRTFVEVKKGYTYFSDNDVIVAKITPCYENGKTALVSKLENGLGAGSTEFHVIRSKKDILPFFIFSFINTDQVRNNGKSSMAGSGGQQRVPSSYFENLSIPTPHLPEQQKIADCLSSLDDLIAAQNQKLATLKTHKKGLMQQLFPAEGATVPRLRFPEFREKVEWEEKKLGDVSEIVRGGSPRPIDDFLTTNTDGLNWLKIGDVNKEAKYVTKTQERVISEALSKTRVVNPGDLILSNSMSFGRPFILKIKTCIHDGWIAVTKIRQNIERDFLYYLIFSENSQSYFLDNAAGSGVLNLNADIIKFLPTAIPSLSEQQKIADCLSSLDDLITVQTRKIEALNQHKKGLMQQLFPQVTEAGA